MKYFKFALIFLAFLLIVTLYDINNFLSIGIISLFLIINISIFIMLSNNIITGCRNVFGFLSFETIGYSLLLSAIQHRDYFTENSKIDIVGIKNSVIFSTEVSVFFFLLFLIIDLSAKEK